jgi:hypothetical protein
MIREVPHTCQHCSWWVWIYSKAQVGGSMYRCLCIDSPHYGYHDWKREHPQTCGEWSRREIL